ncbi:hypothetical protein D081_2325 [Anaerovibrio sp. JC8]|uniref:autotransporter outer membrane beta-barrel domain-containing protein n=1 Tax=Anaerovibrio sp. JC8 TaxID=1240085 RepID=UPI000A0AB0C4|nr:autotransporter outer membrane beta-barrel domain-containing protein [Anaerovibrio sp. JC8]ORT98960.1 hypothetical protein D081_2325 [Anaerovibrio sp. JC8]
MKKIRAQILSGRKLAILTTAVSVGLLLSPSYGWAMTTEVVNWGDKEMVELDILAEKEGFVYNKNTKEYLAGPAEYNLSETLKQALKDGTSYWADVLGPGSKNKNPWQIIVITKLKYGNALASAKNFIADDKHIVHDSESVFVMDQLQDGKQLNDVRLLNQALPPAGEYGFSVVTIGDNLGAAREGAERGWWMDKDTVLPTNEQANDYIATVRHELGHALGIIANINILDKNGKILEKGEEVQKAYKDGEEVFMAFEKTVTDPDSWNLHLVDQNGNKAAPGKIIITTPRFNELKALKPSIKKSDYFIVDNAMLDKSLTGTQGNAYFVGENVTDALAGATFQGISGLPVKGWEGLPIGANTYYWLEGSHLQTTGMMSHRVYSNYTSFMEAELAVMQDLGYKLDRKAYFGHSIYGDGGIITNTQGFFARNADGTAYTTDYSQVPLGIGLHIYGSRNTVTQAADILTEGIGATGVRVDGIENTLIIPSETQIHADGYRGNGILVAYGRGQNVTQQGTVTADGEGGTGARFDFGSSSNGAVDEYRGSYIRYKRWVDDRNGDIYVAENSGLTEMDKFTYNVCNDELKGVLVDNYNLSGRLSGGENAIYIGKNALVKNININDGASINGDITSEWKHFTDASYTTEGTDREPLKLQYDGYVIELSRYVPDLVTNLNFNTTLSYSGNIYGIDNMKINVNKGTLSYGGTADVVNVNVAKNASLFGGTFTVNDMSDKMADGYSDDTTGTFYNHGSIGAKDVDSNMTVNGDLTSDGVLRGYAGGSRGQIIVNNGVANVDGSVISATNALPNEEMTVLRANLINGTVGNSAGNPFAATGMLNTIGIIDGNDIKVQTTAANNLGSMDGNQQETYGAMTDMYQHLSSTGDSRVNEMRPLYSLDSNSAKEALSSLSSNASAQSMSMAQTNSMNSHLVSSRLTEAFARKDVEVALPKASLDTLESKEADNNLSMTMKLAQPVDNDFWFKTTRNWGDGTGSSYYQGTTVAGGWDRAYGKHWRAGAFISYGQMSFADNYSHNGVKDTRLGLYGGFSKGPHSGYVYLDYGWLKNDLTRRITGLNLQAQADYNSRILELGGEYKYDLNAKNMNTWHISPYVNVQLSQLWQDGYSENGAGIFGQRVDSMSNTYFAGGIGLEFRRYLGNGSYAMRLGVKHAFAGADPKLSYGYIGNNTATYQMYGQQDKTHFIMSLGGEAEFAPGWTLAGDFALQKGSHDKDIMAAITLRRMW